MCQSAKSDQKRILGVSGLSPILNPFTNRSQHKRKFLAVIVSPVSHVGAKAFFILSRRRWKPHFCQWDSLCTNDKSNLVDVAALPANRWFQWLPRHCHSNKLVALVLCLDSHPHSVREVSHSVTNLAHTFPPLTVDAEFLSTHHPSITIVHSDQHYILIWSHSA